MNNNYHTQIDKQQNNILNEIAMNHQLMQQMQNFPKIPVNNGPNYQQSIPPQFQSQPIQNQPVPNQPVPNQPVPNQAIPNQPIQNQPIDDDDLELSELPESNLEQQKKLPSDQPMRPITQQPSGKSIQQINNQIQQLINNTATKVPLELQTNTSAKALSVQTATSGRPVTGQNNNLPRLAKNPQQNKPQISAPAPICEPKQNNLVEYVVIPLILIFIFVGLTYPKTSVILRKYVPPMKSLKGFFIRGAILAILYIAVRFVANMVTKPKK